MNRFWGWLVAAAAGAAATAPVAGADAVEVGAAGARAGGGAVSCLRWSGIPYRLKRDQFSIKTVVRPPNVGQGQDQDHISTPLHVQSSSIRRLCRGC